MRRTVGCCTDIIDIALVIKDWIHAVVINRRRNQADKFIMNVIISSIELLRYLISHDQILIV